MRRYLALVHTVLWLERDRDVHIGHLGLCGIEGGKVAGDNKDTTQFICIFTQTKNKNIVLYIIVAVVYPLMGLCAASWPISCMRTLASKRMVLASSKSMSSVFMSLR